MPHNLDRYLIRTSILNAVLSYRHLLTGRLLDVGCGQMPYKKAILRPNGSATDYIGLDLAENLVHRNQPDITWDGARIPLNDECIDSVLCTEVLEHCPKPEEVLLEIYRVLKPSGVALFTVPFIWPLHETPFDHYRYTPYSLRSLMSNAGFGKIEIFASGGWDASLAQLLGLWVRRRKMHRLARSILSIALYPIYRLLILIDSGETDVFREGDSFPGLYCIAEKRIDARLQC